MRSGGPRRPATSKVVVFEDYLATRSFRPFEALKCAYFLAGMVMVWPVAGLRPCRSDRLLRVKLPNPVMLTLRPASSSTAIMPSPSLVEKMMSTISVACAFEMSAVLASLSAISVLFTTPPCGSMLRGHLLRRSFHVRRYLNRYRSFPWFTIRDILNDRMSANFAQDGDVAVVTLNRPDRYNAIDASLSSVVVDLLAQAGREARAVVVTGAGKAFCSGADLAGFQDEYDQGSPDLAAHLDDEFHPLVEAIAGCAVPTVAAVNGVAAGAGMGLALGCDLRVMAESAYFTSAFTAIGLVPDSGSTWLLPHHLGTSLALEMSLTNRRLGAEEALQRGLCLAVTPDTECLAEAIKLAAKLADLPTDALVTTRRLIHSSRRISFTEALEAERAEQGRLGETPEHAEGVRAFLEKRKPDFKNA